MVFVAEIIPQEDLSKFIDNPVWQKLTRDRQTAIPGFSRWVVDRERDMFVNVCGADRKTYVFAMFLHGEFVTFRTLVKATQTDAKKDLYSILWYVYDIEIPSALESLRASILQWIEEFCIAAGGPFCKGPEKFSEAKVLFETPPFELTMY